MQGGKKGLFVNSTGLCAKTYRAQAEFDGQNGKRISSKPAIRAKCGKSGREKKRKRR